MDPLFGSETRARLLEQLALVPRPQSAYRLAKTIGAEPIQVLRILKSLEGFIHRAQDGWVLADDQLRRFLLQRSHRIDEGRRTEKDQLLARFGMRGSHGRQRHGPR